MLFTQTSQWHILAAGTADRINEILGEVGMRTAFGKTGLKVALIASFASSAAYAADDTFVASVTIEEALEINCTNLSFGTILRSGAYTGGQSIYIDPSSGNLGVGTGLTHSGGHARSTCTVSGEDGGDATIVLNDGSGTWNTQFNLIQTSLKLAGQTSVNVELVPSSAANIGNGSFYIGGSVFVPSLTTSAAGTYTSDPITITLTD